MLPQKTRRQDLSRPASACHDCSYRTSKKKKKNPHQTNPNSPNKKPAWYQSTGLSQENAHCCLSSTGGNPHHQVAPLLIVQSDDFFHKQKFQSYLLRKNEKLNTVEISSDINYCSLPQMTQLQFSWAESIETVASDGRNKPFHVFFPAVNTLESFLFHPNSSNTLILYNSFIIIFLFF